MRKRQKKKNAKKAAEDTALVAQTAKVIGCMKKKLRLNMVLNLAQAGMLPPRLMAHVLDAAENMTKAEKISGAVEVLASQLEDPHHRAGLKQMIYPALFKDILAEHRKLFGEQ